jgi:hypothetical protein
MSSASRSTPDREHRARVYRTRGWFAIGAGFGTSLLARALGGPLWLLAMTIASAFLFIALRSFQRARNTLAR